MCAVPNMAVFCSSLTSFFAGMLLTYFLKDFEIFPVALIITSINFAFYYYYYIVYSFRYNAVFTTERYESVKLCTVVFF